MKAGDLQGAARLASEAAVALADVVEAMHEGIARIPFSRARLDGRTTGITGLVYRSIRGTTRVVGGSVDALLAVLAPMVLPARTAGETGRITQAREAVIAALNGVMGDYLEASGNPLAIRMAFRVGGRPLPLEREALARRLPDAGDAVLVLVHGLCMNDLQWRRDGHDHGAALARALGLTAVYLHYNSGAHVFENGRLLAQRLEALVAAWPRPVRRLVLVGHSMGGLVARSALYRGREERRAWVRKVTELVCLGTPHHGAPLERLGRGVELAVGAAPYAAPLARLGRLRSAGITDLGRGLILESRERHVPLPRGIACFALAGSTRGKPAGAARAIPGDGLVPVASALGRHRDPARSLRFAARRRAIAWDTHHMQLLSSPAVLATLRRWLSSPPAAGDARRATAPPRPRSRRTAARGS